MIREMKPGELDTVMELWLEANLEAHPFIPDEYWRKNFETVKALISEGVMVYEEMDELLGFIGIRGDYIAGVFVKKGRRSEGIGEKLIDDAKEHHDRLELNVYLENQKAVKFYLREEFKVSSMDVEEATGAAEYSMVWQNG